MYGIFDESGAYIVEENNKSFAEFVLRYLPEICDH